MFDHDYLIEKKPETRAVNPMEIYYKRQSGFRLKPFRNAVVYKLKGAGNPLLLSLNIID